jgi:hydroxyacylglutathione hydrolase
MKSVAQPMTPSLPEAARFYLARERAKDASHPRVSGVDIRSACGLQSSMRRFVLLLAASLLAPALLACGPSPAATSATSNTSASAGSAGSAGSPAGAGGTGGAPAGGSAGASTASASGGSSTAGAAGSGPSNNGFPDHWDDGLSCGNTPDVAIWEYDEDTFILRQSLCTHFEGPFLYLLFGEDRVFLQDTGTGDADVAGAVSSVIAGWLAKKGKASIDLVVTHSHSHGDHTGGDGQLEGMPDTTVVGTSVNSVAGFFGIADWPTQIVGYDLGGRSLDIIPIPGHQNAHVAVYDRSRGLLLTGDSLYPGRLYVNDWNAYVASMKRLTDFTSAPDHPVTWVLGTHIEMTAAAGQDYAMGENKHPNEHVLQLTLSTLLELEQAVTALGDNNPQYQVHDDFIIYPL